MLNILQPGDEVFGDIAGRGFGGFAERRCVPEKLLAKKSPAITFEEAAALPQAGLLALQGLRYRSGLKKGTAIIDQRCRWWCRHPCLAGCQNPGSRSYLC